MVTRDSRLVRVSTIIAQVVESRLHFRGYDVGKFFMSRVLTIIIHNPTQKSLVHQSASLNFIEILKNIILIQSLLHMICWRNKYQAFVEEVHFHLAATQIQSKSKTSFEDSRCV